VGGGNGLSQNSPFRIADFWGVARPGSTLCLLDGVYQGSAHMITPPAGLNGNSGAHIKVIALNDGTVFLNGQYSNAPLVLNGNNGLDHGIGQPSDLGVRNPYRSPGVQHHPRCTTLYFEIFL